MLGDRRPQGGTGSLTRRVFSIPALVSLAVAGGLLFFLIARFDVDLGATLRQMRNADPWLLGGAFLVHYTTFFFRGVRWRLLLQNTAAPGARVPGAFYCGQLVLLGWFANSIGWLRLGDALRAYMYGDEQDATFSGAIGTILAERALDTVLVVAMLLAVVPFLIDSGDTVTWLVLGLAVALAAGLAAVLGVMAWGRGLAMRRLPKWLSGRYDRFHQGTMGSFRRLPLVTAWGLLGWLAEVARMYLVVKALGLPLGIPLIVFLTLANSLLSLVPTPGGVGAVESGVTGLAVRLSRLSTSAAAALVLVDRFITYLSVILVGAAIFAARQFLRSRAGAG